MDILWWHWVVAGIVLMVAELAVPAFFLIWFGLGAVLVGLVAVLVPGLSLGWEVVLWTVFSVTLVVFWFRVFKPGQHKTRAGLSQGQFAGEVALVTRDIRPYDKGEVRFQKPILGDETWESIADEELKVGERVRVLAVEGNILKVARA